MFDTLAAAQELTKVGLKPEQAAAITHTVQQAVEQGNHVTSDQFKAGQAEMRAEITEVRTEVANLDTRLSKQIAEVRTEVANLDTRLSKQYRRGRHAAVEADEPDRG